MRARVAAVPVRLLALAAVLLLAGCGTAANLRAAPPPAPGRAISVMSFNIRLGLGQAEPKGKIYEMDWGRALAGVIAAIRAVDADVVGLQEVAGTPQIEAIARALDMNYAFEWHGTGSSRPRWWGVGILSKFPIVEATGARISWGAGNTRHVAVATLDVGGTRVMALGIHKDKDLRDGASMARILDLVKDAKGPVLLIGDFNVKPSDPRLDGIKRNFYDTAAEAKTETAKEVLTRGTFYSPAKRIDYVFADKAHFEVLDAALAPPEHRLASDHIGYVAWLRLKGE